MLYLLRDNIERMMKEGDLKAREIFSDGDLARSPDWSALESGRRLRFL